MNGRSVLGLLAVAAVAPMLLTAPRHKEDGAGLDELERRCRQSGLQGLELARFATGQVRDQVRVHSIWQPWEKPEAAVRKGRGWAGQYNIALARLLRRLGFEQQVVHASRVHGLGDLPWWQAGHTWVRVFADGRWHDLTAAHLPGEGFQPLTEVRPVNKWTLPTVSAALVPMVACQAWRCLLTGDPVPDWMAHEHQTR